MPAPKPHRPSIGVGSGNGEIRIPTERRVRLTAASPTGTRRDPFISNSAVKAPASHTVQYERTWSNHAFCAIAEIRRQANGIRRYATERLLRRSDRHAG